MALGLTKKLHDLLGRGVDGSDEGQLQQHPLTIRQQTPPNHGRGDGADNQHQCHDHQKTQQRSQPTRNFLADLRRQHPLHRHTDKPMRQLEQITEDKKRQHQRRQDRQARQQISPKGTPSLR
jgi:hypothetical protein